MTNHFEYHCADSHSLRAVAPVVDGGWDAHHQSRGEVPRDVVVFAAWELALKHVDQHEAELHPL